jgi:hypothetical protein
MIYQALHLVTRGDPLTASLEGEEVGFEGIII